MQNLHRAIVILKELGPSDVDAPADLEAVRDAYVGAQLLPHQRPRNVVVDAVASGMRPDEHRVRMARQGLFDVFDPVGTQLHVAVHLDEVGRLRDSVDVSNAEELEVLVVVRMVVRLEQIVVVGRQRLHLRIRHSTRCEMNGSERLEFGK